jgi:hypothetical protein
VIPNRSLAVSGDARTGRLGQLLVVRSWSFPYGTPRFPDLSRIAGRDHLPSTDDHRIVVRT